MPACLDYANGALFAKTWAHICESQGFGWTGYEILRFLWGTMRDKRRSLACTNLYANVWTPPETDLIPPISILSFCSVPLWIFGIFRKPTSAALINMLMEVRFTRPVRAATRRKAWAVLGPLRVPALVPISTTGTASMFKRLICT